MTSLWRALTAAATASCLALSLAATVASTAGAAGSDRTFRLAPLALSADLPNPLRGQYRWMGYEPTPSTVTSNDVYYRDQVYWGRLEKADNAWDWPTAPAAGWSRGPTGRPGPPRFSQRRRPVGLLGADAAGERWAH